MNNNKRIITKYKQVLKEICKTEYFNYLKQNYEPPHFSLVFNREGKPSYLVLEDPDLLKNLNGNVIPNIEIFKMYPGKEMYAYPLSLLRQFLLKKDEISIYRIGSIIKSLGTGEQFTQYKILMKELKKFEKALSNLAGMSIKEYFDNLCYGDIFHRNIKKEVRDYYANTHFAEYFLRYLDFIYQIALIIKLPDFNDEDLNLNCNSSNFLSKLRDFREKSLKFKELFKKEKKNL